MISYRYYDTFESIPREIRTSILKRLGVSSGVMRSEAKANNPQCVVAFDGDLPVGWSTFTDEIVRKKRKISATISIFVALSHRRQGIGTALVGIAAKLYSGQDKILVFPFNDAGKKFYYQFEEKVKLEIWKGN